MRAFTRAAVIGLTLMGSVGPTFAQYGGPDYGRRDGYDRGYDRRDDYRRDDYRRDRDYDRGYDRRGGGGGGVSFNEREYLRCNPDVRRAVQAGHMESGRAHFETYGRREGRRLSC